jgi:hypothetical protein
MKRRAHFDLRSGRANSGSAICAATAAGIRRTVVSEFAKSDETLADAGADRDTFLRRQPVRCLARTGQK